MFNTEQVFMLLCLLAHNTLRVSKEKFSLKYQNMKKKKLF